MEHENNKWFALLAKYGAYELERRMSKRELYRLYYRRWPYDGRKPVKDIDDFAELLPSSTVSIEDELIGAEQVRLYLATLTPRQREVVERTFEGYKPREIAKMQGDTSSGKQRWHLHVAKNKLTEHLDDQD